MPIRYEQVEGDAHARLLRALWSDTALLSGLGVMDYSLLVGIDQANSTMVVGIIDFIRQVHNLYCGPVLNMSLHISLHAAGAPYTGDERCSTHGTKPWSAGSNLVWA